jgi:DNA-directed RNA polymerase specialized sigma subunit
MRFVEERKQAEIAREIGVSQVHVSRLLQQATAKLRELRATHQSGRASPAGCAAPAS